uniref:SFRICE_038166 n=1 Tax=Spodoptera frugiperda TaxID=7108 RepID=A0A2H1WRD6_SPOFR
MDKKSQRTTVGQKARQFLEFSNEEVNKVRGYTMRRRGGSIVCGILKQTTNSIDKIFVTIIEAKSKH